MTVVCLRSIVFAPVVRNLIVTNTSSSSIRLQWLPPNLPAVPTSYIISYTFRDLLLNDATVQGPNTLTVQSSDTVDLSIDENIVANVQNLTAFNQYNITVLTIYGQNNVSASVSTTGVNVIANTTEDAPTAPVGLMSTSRTATTISLQWNRPATPNGIINMYTLTYSNTTHSLTEDIPVEYVGPEYNVTNITIDILNEFTNYTFNLTATTGGGTGPAATLEVQTNEAGESISCIVIVY